MIEGAYTCPSWTQERNLAIKQRFKDDHWEAQSNALDYPLARMPRPVWVAPAPPIPKGQTLLSPFLRLHTVLVLVLVLVPGFVRRAAPTRKPWFRRLSCSLCSPFSVPFVRSPVFTRVPGRESEQYIGGRRRQDPFCRCPSRVSNVARCS